MSTLGWNLYRPGSELEFRAEVASQGYAIAITRDGVGLVYEQACDVASLLRRSTELRESFQRLGGYTTLPHEEDAALLAGPCWGPGTPVPAGAIASAESSPLSWEEWQTRAAV